MNDGKADPRLHGSYREMNARARWHDGYKVCLA